MGLLDSLFSGGGSGLLGNLGAMNGNGAGQVGGGSIAGGWSNAGDGYFQNNQNAMLGLAAGLLQPTMNGFGGALSQGLQGYMAGRPADQQQQERMALGTAAGSDTTLTPQMRALLKSSPELAKAYLSQTLLNPNQQKMSDLQLKQMQFQVDSQGKPFPTWGVIGKAGDVEKYGWIYPKDQHIVPAPDLPGISSAYRPATDQERQAYGVAQGVPLFIGPDGKPQAMGPQTVVNNVNGENAFDKTVGEGQGKMFMGMAQDGPAAIADAGRIGALRQTLSKLPGGWKGGLQGVASSLGIKLGSNAGDVEAANAIISQLVPAQREGMPGAASDRDVQMFKEALPKLSNTPEGNKLILDTMQGLAEQRQKQAQIATAVTTGNMTRQDGMKALQALPDPFANMRQVLGGQQTTAVPTLQPGQTFKHPNGTVIERLP